MLPQCCPSAATTPPRPTCTDTTTTHTHTPKKRCVFKTIVHEVKKKGLPQLQLHSTLFQSFPFLLLYYAVLTSWNHHNRAITTSLFIIILTWFLSHTFHNSAVHDYTQRKCFSSFKHICAALYYHLHKLYNLSR